MSQIATIITAISKLNLAGLRVQHNEHGTPSERGFWFESDEESHEAVHVLIGMLPALRSEKIDIYVGSIAREFVVLPVKEHAGFKVAATLRAGIEWTEHISCHEFGKTIYTAIVRLGAQGVPETKATVPAEVKETKPAPEFSLSADQLSALNMCVHRSEIPGSVTFVTGKAGTGKSTVLRELRKLKRCAVTAPTGLAALNVGGTTIHSFYGLKPGPQTVSRAAGLGQDKARLLRNIDILVIDEISMTRADLLDGIDQAMRRTLDKDLPFGGKPLVVFGDLWQLEPVLKKDEREWFDTKYQSPFFFDAMCLKPGAHPEGHMMERAILGQVFRQTEADVIEALNKVRTGNAAGLEVFNSRVGADLGDGAVHLCFTNDKALSINRINLVNIEGKTQVYKGQVEGQLKENDLPTEQELRLKVGAQVMFCKNVRGLDGELVANGSVGIVIDMGEREVTVELTDGRTVIASPETWEAKSYKYNKDEDDIEETVDASFTQMPLKLAWAITVHKSQGQTLDAAYIEAERPAFSHGLTYVALSRVKTLDGLSLRRRLTPRDLIVNPHVAAFEEFYGLGGVA